MKIRHELFCRYCGKTRNMRVTVKRTLADKIKNLWKTTRQYNCRTCGEFIKEE